MDEQERQRLDLQRDRVLARLRQGPATARELGEVCSYRQRISELRQMGHRIHCEVHRGGKSIYRLIEQLVLVAS